MNDYQNKRDNSYESSSSGSASSNSVGDNNVAHNSMNFEANEGLTALLVPSVEGIAYFNTSAEEGIFPNVASNCTVAAPSYQPEYDYYNEYSTQPLVYSWMPIVPGFSQDVPYNLDNFDHIIKRLEPQPLNISGANEHNSSAVSDQSKKFENCLVLNQSDKTIYILNNSNGMTFNHQIDDNSCNAMDLNISCNNEVSTSKLDLSFNGKFPELTNSSNHLNEECSNEEANSNKLVAVEQFSIIYEKDDKPVEETASKISEEKEDNKVKVDDDGSEDDNDSSKSEEDSDNERLRNESFELLKKEDSSRMLMMNEKSPIVTEFCDPQDDFNDGQQTEAASSSLSPNISQNPPNELDNENETKKNDAELNTSSVNGINKPKTIRECDSYIMKKFQASLSETCPPQSITTLPLSLSEMLLTYKKNVDKPSEEFVKVETSSLFVPTHSLNETLNAEWPKLLQVKAPGVMYNRNDDCENTEYMTVRYTEKFIKAETSSSFNYKIGPSSAKKRAQKLKLLTNSPGSRLSHLANRRKVFSSANLKSSTTSQGINKTYHGSGTMLIDKSTLDKKKKRLSDRKKKQLGIAITPNKKKTTPKGAKRYMESSNFGENVSALSSSGSLSFSGATSSKRALFTSPARHSKNPEPKLSLLRDVPNRSTLPKRTLFSPPQKRKRSPSPDAENRFGKSMRLDSSSLLKRSQTFSHAGQSTSSVSSSSSITSFLENKFKGSTMGFRCQSELVLNQSSSTSVNKPSLGFRKPFTETEKKKLLWTASSALQSKKINREHEKFKDHMGLLCRLVRKIFSEFYNPAKSMSAQMQKFSNLMVFYVIQGRSFEEIYEATKFRLEAQNPTKISGYISQEDYKKNCYVRQGKSLLLMGSNSSLNISEASDSFASDKSATSDTSLTRSTSKSNLSGILCENLQDSAKKLPLHDSKPAQLKTSTPSTNVLKAKRQLNLEV